MATAEALFRFFFQQDNKVHISHDFNEEQIHLDRLLKLCCHFLHALVLYTPLAILGYSCIHTYLHLKTMPGHSITSMFWLHPHVSVSACLISKSLYWPDLHGPSTSQVKATEVDNFLKGGGALDINSVQKKPKVRGLPLLHNRWSSNLAITKALLLNLDLTSFDSVNPQAIDSMPV